MPETEITEVLFKKTWTTDEVRKIVYEELDRKKDMRVRLTLDLYSKDACNKKNPTPRAKVNFRRCYGLKEGFESVSNFYEVDEEGLAKVLRLVGMANSAPGGRFKAFWRKKGVDYSEVLIRGKFGLLTAISSADELLDDFKAAMTALIQ